MTEHNDREMRDGIKQSFPPVNTALRRDLWPDVLRKFEHHPIRVPWYDWALVGLSTMMFLAFPRLVLVFAYHL